jgi:hypothetical protein
VRWDVLPADEVKDWAAFVESYLAAPGDRQFAAADVAINIGASRRSRIERSVIAAYSSSRSLFHGALAFDVCRRLPRSILQSIARDAVKAVERTREEASFGRYSFGTVRTGYLLASIAQRTRKREVWQAVRDLVLDGAAPSAMRAETLDAMANKPTRTPRWVAKGMRNAPLLRDQQLPLESGEHLQGAWLRYQATHRDAGPEGLLAEFFRLATNTTAAGRIEAAISVDSLIGKVDDDVLGTTALVLSHDQNPRVRAASARSLPALLPRKTSVVEELLQRAIAMLADPGDESPAALLQGIRRSGLPMQIDNRLSLAVEQLSRHHPSRVVRGLASTLFTGINESAPHQFGN